MLCNLFIFYHVRSKQIVFTGKGFDRFNILFDFFSGLAPHCLAILKTCHMLTEKLVGMTMGGPGGPTGSPSPGGPAEQQQLGSPDMLSELVTVARRIGPRVDDVVKALYPPLDPRLLEAR